MKSYTGTQLCGGCFINHEIRAPFLNNQYFVESKRVFFVAQMGPV